MQQDTVTLSTSEDWVSPALARRLAALLDQRPDRLTPNSALPQGWHVILFNSLARASELDADGHARAADRLPSLDYPHRVLAGRETRYLAPIYIGDQLIRKTKLLSVQHKRGRSGEFALVKIEHEISRKEDLVVNEIQSIVYRHS